MIWNFIIHAGYIPIIWYSFDLLNNMYNRHFCSLILINICWTISLKSVYRFTDFLELYFNICSDNIKTYFLSCQTTFCGHIMVLPTWLNGVHITVLSMQCLGYQTHGLQKWNFFLNSFSHYTNGHFLKSSNLLNK